MPRAVQIATASSSLRQYDPTVVPPAQWTDNDWIAIGTVLGAIGSVAVAVLAIWGEPIRAWFFRAKLQITIDMKEPDCIGIKLVQTKVTPLPSGQPTVKQTLTPAHRPGSSRGTRSSCDRSPSLRMSSSNLGSADLR